MNRTDVMIVDLDLSIRGDWGWRVKERLEYLIKLVPMSTMCEDMKHDLIRRYSAWIREIDDPDGISIDGRSVTEFNYIYSDKKNMKEIWEEYDLEYYMEHSIYQNDIEENYETVYGYLRFLDYWYLDDGWEKIMEWINNEL
jgi:hypothetical protein